RREDDAGDDGDGGKLRAAAAATRPAADRRRRRRVPRARSVGERDRVKAAGHIAVDVRDREIRALGVRGNAPLDAAETASTAGAISPDLFAFAIRIERVRDAGFLSGHDQLAAVRQPDERWRRAEIEIGTGSGAAVHLAG